MDPDAVVALAFAVSRNSSSIEVPHIISGKSDELQSYGTYINLHEPIV